VEFYEEIERIRERGIVFNDEETISGLRGVAVPVFGSNDTVYDVVSIHALAYRMQGERFEEKI